MAWSLDHAYDAFPQVEERFGAMLDESVEPRGPEMLFDLVARFGLPPGAVVVDVGCGEGRHAAELTVRFGFAVTGVDPVPRHLRIARARAADAGPRFVTGTAERLPFEDGTVDAIWCRDVVEQFGPESYDMMLGDCLWHVYAMIGKLTRRIYLLSTSGTGQPAGR